jgi:archaemetzincin
MKVAVALIVLVCALTLPQAVHSRQSAESKRMSEQLLIVPFGDVDEMVLSKLGDALKDELELTCTVEKSLEIPAAAYHAARRQYLSTRLLEEMQTRFGGRGVRMLGVVDKDLYVPELNFVFGEADLVGRAAVISLIRLRQERYGLPPDESVFLKRVKTEAVHELGHTYGLRHCRDAKCVMFFSNSLLDTDRKGYRFCARCKTLLAEARRAEQKSGASGILGKPK